MGLLYFNISFFSFNHTDIEFSFSILIALILSFLFQFILSFQASESYRSSEIFTMIKYSNSWTYIDWKRKKWSLEEIVEEEKKKTDKIKKVNISIKRSMGNN
jgi:hypothetical protein